MVHVGQAFREEGERMLLVLPPRMPVRGRLHMEPRRGSCQGDGLGGWKNPEEPSHGNTSQERVQGGEAPQQRGPQGQTDSQDKPDY